MNFKEKMRGKFVNKENFDSIEFLNICDLIDNYFFKSKKINSNDITHTYVH